MLKFGANEATKDLNPDIQVEDQLNHNAANNAIPVIDQTIGLSDDLATGQGLSAAPITRFNSRTGMQDQIANTQPNSIQA